jgi:hypothetical protein
MDQNLSPDMTVGDDPEVKRDVLIRLLVTQAERDMMQAAADEDGLTLSEWIRRRCIKTTTTIEVKADVSRQADPLHGMSAAEKKRMLEFLGRKSTPKGGK